MEKHEQYTFYFGRERLKKPERKRKGQRDNEEDAKENQKRWLTYVCRMKGERLQKAALKYKLTWEKDAVHYAVRVAGVSKSGPLRGIMVHGVLADALWAIVRIYSKTNG
ncbi:Protein of unknown function [Gryllus bimaculatus]|nr:Protein of unknown function [Gryllus bimaculatus]